MNDRLINLIIADDESIIREGVTNKINWIENGFRFAGAFEHGIDALDYIRKNPVDVVISDINMPRMDGLELSRILAKEFPELVVLLLTGYDDFEYAQEAVKNHVRDFILKPITAKELKAVLSTIKSEIEASRAKTEELEEMKKKLSESFPLLRERFFNRLVSSRLSIDFIKERGGYIGWKNLEAYYQLAYIYIPESWEELNSIILSEHIKKILSAEDEVFTDRSDNLVIILQDKDKAALENKTRQIARKTFLRALEFELEQITIGYGELVDKAENIPVSRRGAENAVDYSRVMGISQIVSVADLRSRDQIQLEEFNSLTRELISCLTESNKDEVKNALSAIFEYLKEHYISGKDLPFYFARLHYLLYYFIREMDLIGTDEEFFPGAGEKFGSLTEARLLFDQIMVFIEERIHSRRHDLVISRMDRARTIIAERFREPDFSLHDICNDLYLSVSQFSLIFKEGTGRTFVEYLTSHRMEEAKRLLKSTDLKGYEIAEKVGYLDPRYFSLVFKKYTGMTTMEFRKSLEA